MDALRHYREGEDDKLIRVYNMIENSKVSTVKWLI